MARSVAEHLVDTLARAGVRQIYGVVGDSLNPVTDALRRNGTIKWVDVRHEESGAYAAGAEESPTTTPSSPSANHAIGFSSNSRATIAESR
jgi:thiamine pyrophosphate-dependent acetolactate synthase large subunit-like protein